MSSAPGGRQPHPIWRFPATLEQLSQEHPFVEVADFGGEASVELYKPIGEDRQSPHTKDELYVVASGSGMFTLENSEFAFDTGDVIFVPAHAEHRFSSFSDDFSTWVIFFGPQKAAP